MNNIILIMVVVLISCGGVEHNLISKDNTTATIGIWEPEPIRYIEFVDNSDWKNPIAWGKLTFGDGKFTFVGDPDESAKVFFNYLQMYIDAYYKEAWSE